MGCASTVFSISHSNDDEQSLIIPPRRHGYSERLEFGYAFGILNRLVSNKKRNQFSWPLFPGKQNVFQ